MEMWNYGFWQISSGQSCCSQLFAPFFYQELLPSHRQAGNHLSLQTPPLFWFTIHHLPLNLSSSFNLEHFTFTELMPFRIPSAYKITLENPIIFQVPSKGSKLSTGQLKNSEVLEWKLTSFLFNAIRQGPKRVMRDWNIVLNPLFSSSFPLKIEFQASFHQHYNSQVTMLPGKLALSSLIHYSWRNFYKKKKKN